MKWLEEWGEREGEVKHIVAVLSSTSLLMFCWRYTEMPWIKWMTSLEGVSSSNRWECFHGPQTESYESETSTASCSSTAYKGIALFR